MKQLMLFPEACLRLSLSCFSFESWTTTAAEAGGWATGLVQEKAFKNANALSQDPTIWSTTTSSAAHVFGEQEQNKCVP